MARFFLNHVGLQNFSTCINNNIHRKILRNKQKMRLLTIIMFFSLIYFVAGKSNVKTLTESMGQEIIEIGAPIKELPMGLDAEPSAEEYDDDKASLKTTGNTSVLPTTKKDAKNTTTQASVMKHVKDVETTDALNQDDDEARIEKELAEMYKDTADYKTDSSEEKVQAEEPRTNVEQVTEEETSAEESDKPIGRRRGNFRFQPDSTDKESVEKFRTSVDEISCNSRQKLRGTVTPSPETATKDAFRTVSNGIILITAVLSYVFICT